MGIMTKELGIDLGTSNIRIYAKGRGIVLDEPSVVAINKITSEVLAVGKEAKEMLGRTPDNIIAVKPLKDGVIADFMGTKMLVQTLISKVVPKTLFQKLRLVVSVPCGITDVEERAVEGVLYKVGAKDVYLMEESMAAAIGAGLKVKRPEGCMIVDIGAGTSEIAVLSLEGIVVSNSIRLGGDKLDKDIIDYIRVNFNVIISETEAEEIKKQIGSVTETMTEEKMNVKGRNLTTGLPNTITVTSKDIKNAMQDSIDVIIKAIKSVLEQTPPELSSDIMEQGITLSGGCAQINNIDMYISDKIGIPVHIAQSPLECVAKGVGTALEVIEVLKKAVKTRKNR
ncbi:MAG: rod shape-determining protein [Clostridia bacterium]|nr:rod shape-determining protein [Clostridia bacterium]